MPTEKAHGIQIAKMCEAFIEAGKEVVVLSPTRRTSAASLREYYGLRVEVPLVRLFAPDWYTRGRFLYRLSSFCFVVSAFVYLRRRREPGSVVYAIDADNWSYTYLPLLRMPCFVEMHGTKPVTAATRFFFSRASGIIPINSIIQDRLAAAFGIRPARILVAHDGVDTSRFAPMDRFAARAALGLPQNATVILYTGRIFTWKGLDVFPDAASRLGPGAEFAFVGGTRGEFDQKIGTGPVPPNLVFYGGRPFTEMPKWIAAANAVVVSGTRHDENSYWWTSPMKLFEYMACGVPIVAVNTPAVREIASEKNAYLYEPDDAQSLARAIKAACEDPTAPARAGQALIDVRRYTWRNRAERVIRFIEERSSYTQ